ncbi:MAG: glycosyltransferase family 4 protein [Balneolales bacterium]|nr:glycosyltransferase family 4 protein [Balneolales bacterium]
MRVLTVCSSHNGKPGVVVQNQVESLVRNGVQIHFYLIHKKGLNGYLWHIGDFRRYLRDNKPYDLVHAHYSFCGFVAALAGAKPLLVSLMGSDSQRKSLKPVLKIFHRFFWSHVIIKSQEQQEKTGLKSSVSIIPNGVEIDLFSQLNKLNACKKVNFDEDKKNILFLADPSRAEKNVERAKEAVKLLNQKNTVLHIVHGISHNQVNKYLHACDVLLLTSNYEGSPNIIKEALAANCRIVSTPVGDVPWLLKGVPGTYITSFNPVDIADKLSIALQYKEKVEGRKRLEELELGADQVAQKVIKLYKSISAGK